MNMAWYDETVFYHIYPLGLCGAPEWNHYGEPVHRLLSLIPWIAHLKELGCSGLYIGPLFESGSHGYDTTDYRKLDSRLGTNDDLKVFTARCHEAGIRVILDGVFNHTGRDFFAFGDLLQYRENSRYRDWYCGVNFRGNNEYNDGFSYDNWGGYNLLAKLNLRNPEVRDYLLDTIRFWVDEFDIDGLRLDAADVLDFDFMRSLRGLADTVKPEFWLMGEVIHGDYSRWVNEHTLHSVTNYHLHKALYSAHNDRNYFEIAHTVRRQLEAGLGRDVKLYSFVDNHDVERILSKLARREDYLPVHVLLYTIPGIPSIYYGSEFGIRGRKEYGSDASLRPYLNLEECKVKGEPYVGIIKTLGKIYAGEQALWYGDYRELQLTTTKYAFARGDIIITANCGDGTERFDLPGEGAYLGVLSGKQLFSDNGRIRPELAAHDAEIWVPQGEGRKRYESIRERIAPEAVSEPETVRGAAVFDPGKSYDEMTVPELQAAVLAKLAANDPVTDRMKKDVYENIYRDSLLNWVKSFR